MTRLRRYNLAGIAIVVLITISLGIYLYQLSYARIISESEFRLEQLVTAEQKKLTVLSESWANFFVTVSRQPILYRYAEASFLNDASAMAAIKPEVEQMFLKFNQIYPKLVRYMRFIGANGVEQILVKNNQINQQYKDRNNRAYFSDAVDQPFDQLGVPGYRKGSTYTALDWSIALGRSDAFYGVFTITLDMAIIGKMTTPMHQVGVYGYFYLLDSDGKQIVGAGAANFGQRPAAIHTPIELPTEAYHADDDHVLVTSYIPMMDIHVAVIEYPDQLRKIHREEFGQIAGVLGFSGLGMIFLITLLSSKIQRQIEVASLLSKNAIMFERLREADFFGIVHTSADGSIIEANDTMLNLLGYTRQDLQQGKLKWTEITPPELLHLDENAMKESAVGDFFTPFEKEYFHKDGHRIPVIVGGSRFKANPDEYIVFIVDISERKRIEEKLSYQATHDALTGLINRHEFERRAERTISTAQAGKGEHALCYMDLDQFKVVNDTCGHSAGDELLRQLGHVLQDAVRNRDTLARLGGDEFGVLMEHCTLDQAQRVANELQHIVQDFQFFWEGQSFRIGVSIGLVAITETTPSLTELLKQADAACYMAKDLGRNRIQVYRPEDTELAQRYGEMQWVARINRALEENRFTLYAQSIVPLDKSTDKHYELLLRMVDEHGETIPPGAFLPAAERYNIMDKLDAWVVENAFALMASHPAFVEQIHFISINLSGQSLTNDTFLDLVIAQIKASKIDAGKICFEVTETAAISNLSAATTFISTLRGLGCRFALDDFGSGLSSFGYLKNLPVDYLKIDGMFVKDMVDDPIDRAMVKSINDIGHVMGMKTIAEFVENDQIKSMLTAIGVDYAQGYGIGKPQPFDELLDRSNQEKEIDAHLKVSVGARA